MTDRRHETDHRAALDKMVRPKDVRPSLRQTIGRSLAVVVANAVAMILLNPLLDGFELDDYRAAFLAGLVIGILNALVWPAVAFLVVPLSVLTLGVGAIVVNALVVGLALDPIPGVRLDGLWPAILLTLGLTAVTTVLTRLLAIDDVAWFDDQMAHRARRRRDSAHTTDIPGVVFVQVDGVAESVLRHAMSSGDAPTLHDWVQRGSHDLQGWVTQWSSQTGVSQCGILQGSNDGMPAFRWLERSTGKVMVSNRPVCAAEIEQRHSDGNGLLAHDGSSYGNLFSGDAERAVLTMSGAGRVKEGRIGAGYGRYFSRPSNAAHTLIDAVVDLVRDRRAARDQRRRDVRPRIERSMIDSLLRAFTTVVSRDVCVNGILGDVAEGRSAIYVDLLGYDEVSHHSGPQRADTLGVLRDIDRQISRIERSFRWAPRPYHLIVLSDHGQTQGEPFEAQHGESLEQIVERLTGTDASSDPDSVAGRTESTAWFRSARGEQDRAIAGDTDVDNITVLGSGSLGLVYLGSRSRLTLEEVDERHPELIPTLRTHPGIGFVMVRSTEHGAMALGPAGHRLLDRDVDDPDAVEGDDPLAPFGAWAVPKVAEVDRYEHVADLMINARYDPETDEVSAFEHQVGSHGGLGGPQTHPFLLYPSALSPPEQPIESAVDLHHVLKNWLAEVGQPAIVREPTTEEP